MGRGTTPGNRLPTRSRPRLGCDAAGGCIPGISPALDVRGAGSRTSRCRRPGQVRGPIRAAASPRLLPFVREKLLETLRVHESPLVAPGGFPTLEGDEMAPLASERTFAGFLASGFGPAFPSGSVLSAVSPSGQSDSDED